MADTERQLVQQLWIVKCRGSVQQMSSERNGVLELSCGSNVAHSFSSKRYVICSAIIHSCFHFGSLLSFSKSIWMIGMTFRIHKLERWNSELKDWKT